MIKVMRTKSIVSSEDGINAFKKRIFFVILDIWLNNSKLDGFQTLEKIRELITMSL